MIFNKQLTVIIILFFLNSFYLSGENKKENFKVNEMLRAISDEDFKQVKRLIDEGACINCVYGYKRTLIFKAVRSANYKICKYLIEHGAEVSVQDKSGHTPLMWAACFKNLKIAKLLIQSKADLNLKDHKGLTALHNGAECGNLKFIKLLIQSGAEKNPVNKLGLTPLAYVLKHNYPKRNKVKTISFLLKNVKNINYQDKYGRTVLHYIAQTNNIKFAEMILEKGANPLNKDNSGKTPIDIASEYRNRRMVRFLKKRIPKNLLAEYKLEQRKKTDMHINNVFFKDITKKDHFSLPKALFLIYRKKMIPLGFSKNGNFAFLSGWSVKPGKHRRSSSSRKKEKFSVCFLMVVNLEDNKIIYNGEEESIRKYKKLKTFPSFYHFLLRKKNKILSILKKHEVELFGDKLIVKKMPVYYKGTRYSVFTKSKKVYFKNSKLGIKNIFEFESNPNEDFHKVRYIIFSPLGKRSVLIYSYTVRGFENETTIHYGSIGCDLLNGFKK